MNCDPTIEGNFTFIEYHSHTYYFNVISPHLCVKLPMRYETEVYNINNYKFNLGQLRDEIWSKKLKNNGIIYFNIGDGFTDKNPCGFTGS